MGRRHLNEDEARFALNRGKGIHALLGSYEHHGKIGIRWVSLSKCASGIRIWVFEAQVPDPEHFVGLDHLSPLDPAVVFGDPSYSWISADFAEALATLAARFPQRSINFVNEGMIDDEYFDVSRRDDASS